MNTITQSSTSIPGVKYTIAVASGKGGVGKSTVAVNLALALAKEGYKTGLIDADIYGPSIPLMLGVSEQPKIVRIDNVNKLLPVEKHSIKLMSIGFLVSQKEAVIWRGPMAASALKQFINDTEWGELDYLLFDMPPGTGDIQLTLTQLIPLTGSVIVTTPQEIAIADARKGSVMFSKVNVPVIGIIENMSYYETKDGSKDYIFGKGGGESLSKELNINFLGEIGINSDIRAGGDEGNPIVLKSPDSKEAIKFIKIARKLTDAVKSLESESKKIPQVEISLG